MIKVRGSKERGHANHGWLDSYHSFSFADYYDEEHMGYRSLRVINEDRVAPGKGFGAHPHRDMEIVTYVLAGSLEHKDSLGTGSIIKPGEIQRMSAGRGITHSEFNASKSESVHLLQIWITPKERGIDPGYEQKSINFTNNPKTFTLIASENAVESAVTIHQDAKIYASRIAKGEEISHALTMPYAWLQVAQGEVELNGTVLQAGDGAQIEDEKQIIVKATRETEVILFEMNN
ncbi:MAG: pirin family protein [bacterium]|nr:pirin family protein [bacterium]